MGASPGRGRSARAPVRAAGRIATPGMAAPARATSVTITRPPLVPGGRLEIAVSPGRYGRAALKMYRPYRWRGRLVKHAVRLAAIYSNRANAVDPLLELLGETLRSALDTEIQGAGRMASSASGRNIIGLVAGGRLAIVAKVGQGSDQPLRNEAAVLAGLQHHDAIRVSQLVFAGELDGHFVCATRFIPGRARRDLAAAVAASQLLADSSWTHGDLTPWNLVGRPAALLDWEHARPGLLPLFDLAHFVVRSAAVAGRGGAHGVIGHLCHPGSAGAAYLASAGLPLADAPGLLRDYLDRMRTRPVGARELGLHNAIRRALP